MTNRLAITLFLLLFLVGCQFRKPRLPTPSSSWQWRTPSASLVSPTSSQERTTVTVSGTVQDVMLSAQVITLQTPAEGFRSIVLTRDTRLLSAEGTAVSLSVLRPGTTIRATGRPGTSGALIADEIRILRD